MKNTYKMICFAAVAAIAACGLACTVRADETDPEIYISQFEWRMADLVGVTRYLSEDTTFTPERDYDVNQDGFVDMSDYCAINEWVCQASADYAYWVEHSEYWLPQLYDLLWCYEQGTGVTPEQSYIGIGVDPVSWLESAGGAKYAMQVCFSYVGDNLYGYDITAQHPYYNGIGYPSDVEVQPGDVVMTLFVWNPGTQEPDFIADRFDAIIERGW